MCGIIWNNPFTDIWNLFFYELCGNIVKRLEYAFDNLDNIHFL